jgi:hypothetical protein
MHASQQLLILVLELPEESEVRTQIVHNDLRVEVLYAWNDGLASLTLGCGRVVSTVIAGEVGSS